jgi:hypothetical protein
LEDAGIGESERDGDERLLIPIRVHSYNNRLEILASWQLILAWMLYARVRIGIMRPTPAPIVVRPMLWSNSHGSLFVRQRGQDAAQQAKSRPFNNGKAAE